MATFSIKFNEQYYDDIGTGGKHNMTTWQVAKDSNFHKIIDESLEDHINILTWSTPLPKLPEDKVDQTVEEFYSDLQTLYLRVKIHVGVISKNDQGEVISKTITASSDWVNLGPVDQRRQDIDITQNGEYVRKTTTEELGWLD